MLQRVLTAIDLAASWLAAPRRAALAAVGLTLALGLPALGVGAAHDDFVHRPIATGMLPDIQRGPTELYEFVPAGQAPGLREAGYLPWWTDPELAIRFLRPLGSALLTVDVALFGDALVPAHVHSLVWLALVVLCVHRFLRELLPPREAGLATAIYAIAGCLTMPSAWIAARYAAVAACFAIAALWLHVGGRRRDQPARRVAALACLCLGLSAGESALAAVPVLIAYEALGARDGRLTRLLAAAPVAIVTVAYVVLYKALGYGAARSGMYLDPLADPAGYAAAAAVRVPTLAADLLTSLPALASAPDPRLGLAFAIIGLGACAALAIGVHGARAAIPAAARAQLPWLAIGGALGLLPGAAGVPGGRAVLVPMAAAAALLGCLLASSHRAAPHARGIALGFAVVLAVMGPLTRLGLTALLRTAGAEEQRVGATLPAGCRDDAVMLAAADPGVTMYAPLARVLSGATGPRRFLTLSMAPQAHRVERITPTGFDLVTVGERRTNPWELIAAATAPAAGTRVTVPLATIDVVEATRAGASRLRVELGRPLDDPSLCLLAWRDGSDRQLSAAELAATATAPLPHQPGPLGL